MSSLGKGFSLIELMVAIVIIGILLAVGLPSMTIYSRNIKVRAAAESFLAAAQLARGEAVRLNTNVELILTNAAPIADTGADGNYPVLAEEVVDNLGATVATGKLAANQPTEHASSLADPSYNWLVRTLPSGGGTCGANPGPDPGQQAKACWFISGKRGAEGSGGASDSDSQVLIDGPASVRFSPLGGASALSEFNFSSRGKTCAAVGGEIRCLRVRVESGGRVKLCDPAATAAGDTRGC